MHDSDFKILFLGENPSWSKLSDALAHSPGAALDLHRLDSLADLFQELAAGHWHAVALDVHAWNFQGLQFVEKIRSEYPALPILALYSSSVPDLDSKAGTSGASRCLSLDSLSADALHSAVASCLVENKTKSHLRKAAQIQLALDTPDSSTLPSSKNQLIAHALNNLLCVISANADLLSDHLSSSAPATRNLSEIKKAAQSAAALMRQLK
jgi:DNA-binding NarL/FixJ family response regulator